MKKKTTPFLQALALLTFVWLLFFGITFFLSRNVDEIEYHVPKSATFQLKFDGKKLFNDVVFNTFIDQQDDGLNDVLFRLMNDKSQNNEREFLAGIEFLNTISYFTDEFNGKIIQGVIFRLISPELWDKNAEKLSSGVSYAQRKGTTGLLIFSDKASKSELKNYVASTNFSQPPTDFSKKSDIQFSYHSQLSPLFEQIHSSISHQNNFLLLNGSVKHSFVNKSSEFNIDQKDFHFHSSIVPKELNDTLRHFAQQIGFEIPKIRAVSINYSGIELTTANQGMIPLPLADFILEFEEAFSIAANLERLASKEIVEFKFSKTSMLLEIGTKKYYCKQLSPNSIYCGVSQHPKISKNSSSSMINMKGNPNALIAIKGSKWMVGAIKMSTDYAKFENALQDIENIELSTQQHSKNELNYTMNIEYKTEKKALNEVLKLLLTQ